MIGADPAFPDGYDIAGARDVLVHRGPDDSGLYRDRGVVLGHRRLSIIDIDGGHQPMLSADGKICLVFNGEIYNFRELRSTLEAKGHRFRTRSDTEVLLALYAEHGIAGFSRLNGIFAFAIWDKRDDSLHLVRDQMGIKPLYYAKNSRGLMFASECKALFAAGFLQPRLNSEAFPEYLLFRDVAGEDTLFSGVERLLPGHVLTLRNGHEKLTRYWDVLEEPAEQFEGSFSQSVDALDEHLRNAVRDQMVSDVPLGTFCSGGVDSSLVTAMAAEFANGKLNTFSVAFDESSFDESIHARAVSSRYATHHHEIRVSNQQFADSLPKLIWHNDEPLHFPNSVQIHAISQLAREHVTVVLTGEGADELFWGYPRYLIPRLRRYWRAIPGLVQRNAVRVALGLGDHRLVKLHTYAGQTERHTVLMNACAGNPDSTMSLFPEAKQGISAYRNMLYDRVPMTHDPIARLAYLDQQTYLVSILNRQDKMSMATSIESRVPFLDTRMVRFANSLPGAYKSNLFDNKRIVKALARRYLPKSVVDRRKSGFGVPIGQWFRSDEGLGRLVSQIRDDSILSELVQRDRLTSLIQAHRGGAVDHSDLLWALLNIGLWSTEFGIKSIDYGCAAA